MTQNQKISLWSRVTQGLEWVAAAEASLIPGVQNIKISHRNLFFTYDDPHSTPKLKCVDDTYIIWSIQNPITHTRQGLDDLKKVIINLPHCPVKISKTISNLRVTASTLGKYNYSRFEIEDLVGEQFKDQLGLKYINTRLKINDFDINSDTLWLRIHVTYDEIYIGIRLHPFPHHRRIWRTEKRVGLLHPPVAAALCLLADLQDNQTVIDPFCGSGTLLIEAGLQNSHLKLIGQDICKDALKIAKVHSEKSKVPLTLIHNDSANSSPFKNIDFIAGDRVISNPPWGRTIEYGGHLNSETVGKSLLSNLKPQGRGVFIIEKGLNLFSLLPCSLHKILLICPIRISGRLCELVVIGTSTLFPDTKLGKALFKTYKM